MNKAKKTVSKTRYKNEHLNIRLSQNEKRRLKRKAEKCGLSVSGYSRALLFGDNEKQQNLGMVNQCVILCQDILNIVQEKYSCEDNSLLEEKVGKLWNLLS